MRKILYFLGAFIALVGGGGSFCYSLYLREWFLAIGIAVLCYAAFPTVKGWVKELLA